MPKIKALSMRQPWANSLFTQGRNVENRSRSTKVRGWVAVHSTNTRNHREFEMCRVLHGIESDPEQCAYGSVLGFMKIAEVITKETVSESTKKWFAGPQGLVIDQVIRLKVPVKVKGSLGFWDLKDEELQRCLSQLVPDQIADLKANGMTEVNPAIAA